MTFLQLIAIILMLMIGTTVIIKLRLTHGGSSEVTKNRTRMISWWLILIISLPIVFFHGWVLLCALVAGSCWATVELSRLRKMSAMFVYWMTSFTTIFLYSFIWYSADTPHQLWFALPLICAATSLLLASLNALSVLLYLIAVISGLMSIALFAKHPVLVNIDTRLLLLLLLFLTTINDIAQYCIGKIKGRYPLSVTVSPDKTIEGALGGLVVTSLLCTIMLPTIIPAPWYWCTFIGFLTACAGITGDLYVSWLKRYAGVKDCGQLIPGHGGLLDRTDSLIMTAPVFAYLLITTMERLA